MGGDEDREAEMAAEEANKWRCRLLIKISGKLDYKSKCVLPLEFKERWTAQRNKAAASAAPSTPVPKIKIKLPVASSTSSQPKRFKRWPKVQGVSFPGRTNPVTILIKLAIPAGQDTDSEPEREKGREEDVEEDVARDDGAGERRRSRGDSDGVQAGSERVEEKREGREGREGRGKEGGEEEKKRQEQIRKRKEMVNREKDQKTASTIEKILNQEGQAKRREEHLKTKRKREQDAPDAQPRRRVDAEHLRYVSNASGNLLAFSSACPVPEWMQQGAMAKGTAGVHYDGEPLLISVPWYNLVDAYND